jgi:hypothetical protein
MAEAESDPTRTSSNWLSILGDVFPRWRDRLGSAKDAKAQLEALLCNPETRSALRHVDASGQETPSTSGFLNADFWPDRLLWEPDADGGDDHLAVNYGEPYVDYYSPDGRWEFYVRRLDVERWERLHPKLAAPPAAPSKEPTLAAPAPSEELSNTPRQKPGPKPDFEWGEIETKCYDLMDYHGEFTLDDPEWDCQARLETALMNFCEETWGRRPAPSTLRERLPNWLSAWRERKPGAA